MTHFQCTRINKNCNLRVSTIGRGSQINTKPLPKWSKHHRTYPKQARAQNQTHLRPWLPLVQCSVYFGAVLRNLENHTKSLHRTSCKPARRYDAAPGCYTQRCPARDTLRSGALSRLLSAHDTDRATQAAAKRTRHCCPSRLVALRKVLCCP